jgi:hypothetical protein
LRQDSYLMIGGNKPARGRQSGQGTAGHSGLIPHMQWHRTASAKAGARASTPAVAGGAGARATFSLSAGRLPELGPSWSRYLGIRRFWLGSGPADARGSAAFSAPRHAMKGSAVASGRRAREVARGRGARPAADGGSDRPGRPPLARIQRPPAQPLRPEAADGRLLMAGGILIPRPGRGRRHIIGHFRRFLCLHVGSHVGRHVWRGGVVLAMVGISGYPPS